MKNGIVRGQHPSDSWGNSIQNPKEGFKARLQEVEFKNPKGMSFGHKANVRRHISEGTASQEYRFVLIDYRNGNEQIKRHVMSHQEAWRKNKTLEGTGLAWAKVDV